MPQTLFSTDFVGADGTDLTTFNALFYNVQQNMVIDANNAVPSGSGGALADLVGISKSFSPNQFASATVGKKGTACFAGVSVRCGAAASGSAYHYFGSEDISFFAKFVGGVQTVFGTGAGFNVADVVYLEADGTTITPLLNGSPDISPVTDSDLASGTGGLCAYSGGAVVTGLESFFTGNLRAAGGLFPGVLPPRAFFSVGSRAW